MPLLIFTDLDASLMDEYYSYDKAKTALDLIKINNVPLIFNSSKTLTELISISDAFDGTNILIGENGSSIGIPLQSKLALKDEEFDSSNGYNFIYQKNLRSNVLSIINKLRGDFNFSFKGFFDMGFKELSELTGLTHDAAKRALSRETSEPIIWEDTDDKWNLFINEIGKHDIKAELGGRFYHLMDKAYDKSIGMKKVLSIFKKNYPQDNWKTLAIGDSENDIKMLESADYAIVISNPQKGNIILKRKDYTLSKYSSSKGWNDCMLEFFESTFNNI